MKSHVKCEKRQINLTMDELINRHTRELPWFDQCMLINVKNKTDNGIFFDELIEAHETVAYDIISIILNVYVNIIPKY